MQYFYVHVMNAHNYIGKVHCTEADLRAALGPYITIEPNGVVIAFAKPPKG